MYEHKRFMYYFSIGGGISWKPWLNWNFGESTHFIHKADDWSGDGIPLNKEWSISLHWLWFHLNISFEIPLEVDDG